MFVILFHTPADKFVRPCTEYVRFVCATNCHTFALVALSTIFNTLKPLVGSVPERYSSTLLMPSPSASTPGSPAPMLPKKLVSHTSHVPSPSASASIVTLMLLP